MVLAWYYCWLGVNGEVSLAIATATALAFIESKFDMDLDILAFRVELLAEKVREWVGLCKKRVGG